MATIQELLDLAYQIRDAEQNGENTALRVGQFLVELVNHFNTKADVDNISGAYHLKQQQAPIMALMSVQQMSDSNGQDNKAWWSTDGHIKYQHNGRIYDLGTPAYMLYYCGDKIYKWTGSATGFKLMTDGGGGSSGGGASVFANFAVATSTNELPDNGVATTGYIVGQNLYAYVGTGGDTKGGKYQDLGELNAAGVSLTTNGDGTFTVHSGGNDYTVNLNHTHPNMAKLIVCEESDLPSTLDNDTIYAITDSGETEIEKLIIKGMEFAGGGVPDTGMPQVTKPSTLRPLNLGNNTGSGVSALVDVKARNLNYNGSTDGLTISVGQNSGLLLSYDQTVDATSITIPQLEAETGCQITVKYTGSGALDDGALVFSHDNAVLASVVVVVVVVAPVALSAIKLTGTQWLQTDYCPNADTEFELETNISGFTASTSATARQIIFDCEFNANESSSNRRMFRCYYNGELQKLTFVNESSASNPPGSLNIQAVVNTAVNGVKGIIKYTKGTAEGTFACGSSTVATSLKSSTMDYGLKIGHGRTSSSGTNEIANFTAFIIYRLTITEGGTTVRNYVPATLNGVPGLHDTITDAFISSETSTNVEPIE